MDVRGVRRVALALAPLVILASAGAATSAPQQRAEPGRRFDLVSENDRGRVADESSVSPVTSRDGRLVAFTSYALNLDPRVRAGRNKQIYLWDARTGRLRLALRRPHGGILEDAEVPALSPNGRFLAFCSRDPKIVRPDSRASDDLFWADQDVFVADLRSGQIRRASSDHRGGMADGYSCTPQVADTGDVVFSSFATDLVRGDDNEVADTFLWDWSSRAPAQAHAGRRRQLRVRHRGRRQRDRAGDDRAAGRPRHQRHRRPVRLRAPRRPRRRRGSSP